MSTENKTLLQIAAEYYRDIEIKPSVIDIYSLNNKETEEVYQHGSDPFYASQLLIRNYNEDSNLQ
jgi:hypothetical protein